MAQQFNYPNSETELRATLDELYRTAKAKHDQGERPSFKGLIEIMSAEATINPISWLPLTIDMNTQSEELTAEQISIEVDGHYKVVVTKGFDRDQLQEIISILHMQ